MGLSVYELNAGIVLMDKEGGDAVHDLFHNLERQNIDLEKSRVLMTKNIKETLKIL